jgi:broad specificity phosphatase PhoE
VVVDALCEIDMGDLEGRSDPQTWHQHDEIYQRWWYEQDDEACTLGGESFTAVKARFLHFTDSLLEDEPLVQSEVLWSGMLAYIYLHTAVIVQECFQ